MASEEELEGLEQSVTWTMTKSLIMRMLGGLGVAIALMTLELYAAVLAVIGCFMLPAPLAYAAGVVVVVYATVRVVRLRHNRKLQPSRPGKRSGILIKSASLSLNVLSVAAFAAWMPLPVAIAIAGGLLIVELLLWWRVRGFMWGELDSIRNLLDGGPSQTWEI